MKEDVKEADFVPLAAILNKPLKILFVQQMHSANKSHS